MPAPIFVGTAGWTIPALCRADLPAGGSQLERYAAVMNAAEINSSFYRPHQRTTYERWAASTPEAFRFSVKVPKTATHERRLIACEDVLDRFVGEIAGLGGKLAVVLVQLPPSMAFGAETAAAFFAALEQRTHAAIACEPRHATWFTGEADAFLASRRVVRVGADPARAPGAGEPGGWGALAYYRLHGSPRMYWSSYEDAAIAATVARLKRHRRDGVPAWCIYDNTASSSALPNALATLNGLAN